MKSQVKISPSVKKKLSDEAWTLSNIYRIVDKNGESIPFKPNFAQKQMLENYHYRNIVLKARQIGSTTFWCLFFLNKALFNPNQRLGIISYSLSSASDIFNKILKTALRTLPEPIKNLPQCHIVSDSAREVSFANGSSIRVDTSMRSGTLSGLLVSEFGKICARYPAKAKEIMTGSLQAVPLTGICVIESTAEGEGGYFHDLWKESWKLRDKKDLKNTEFKPFFFPWWKNKEYEL